MKSAVIYDCEFLTKEGAMRRLWSGMGDPDPIVVQIGAVRVSLEDGFPIEEKLKTYIKPLDRDGNVCALDPFFIELTGITEKDISREGLDLAAALEIFSDFGEGCSYWAWGKDELYMMGLSCFIAGISPSVPAARFGNMKEVFVRGGMPEADVLSTSSGQLAEYYQLPVDINAHDALEDALSIVAALQHLSAQGKVKPEWLV